MLAALGVVLPLFLLMGTGYLAARLGWVGEGADKGLGDFVFVLAAPTLIFRGIVTAPSPEVAPFAFVAAGLAGVFLVWALVSVAAMRFAAASRAEAIVAGFAAAQANGVFVGMPLVLGAYGPAANAPLILTLALFVPIMMVVGAVLLEASGKAGDRRALALSLARHPLLIAVAAGLVWRLTGAALPGFARPAIDALAGATVPAALVALGMTLSRYGIARDGRLTALIVGAKLALQPLIVLAACALIADLPAVWRGTAVIHAAAPTGVNAYLFAVRYGAGEAVTSSAIVVATALSIITATLWLTLLGVGG